MAIFAFRSIPETSFSSGAYNRYGIRSSPIYDLRFMLEFRGQVIFISPISHSERLLHRIWACRESNADHLSAGAATAEMAEAHGKVVRLAFSQT